MAVMGSVTGLFLTEEAKFAGGAVGAKAVGEVGEEVLEVVQLVRAQRERRGAHREVANG